MNVMSRSFLPPDTATVSYAHPFLLFLMYDPCRSLQGDAFRCGGCPFLGKPAFEKGQERLVMLSDLDAQQDN